MKKYILIVLFLIYATQSLYSQSYNNYQFIIGDRAAGIGGAYTALVNDDSTALWYNPAGLATLQSTKINISVNGYNYYDRNVKGYWEFAETSGNIKGLNLEEDDLTIVAHTMVFGKDLGKFGGFAFGLFVPNQEALKSSIEGNAIGPNYEIDINSVLDLTSKDLDALAGYGIKITKKVNIGASVGVSYYSQQAKQANIQTFKEKTKPEIYTDTYISEETFTQYLLHGSIGIQVIPITGFTIGIQYRTPSFNLFGSIKSKTAETFIGSFHDGSEELSEISKVKINNKKNKKFDEVLPDRLALGLSYEQKKSWAVSFDIERIGKPSGYITDVYNFKLGAEIYINQEYVVRLGGFTDFTQNIKSKDKKDNLQNEDFIDFYGITASFSFATKIKIKEKKSEKFQLKTLWTTIGLMYRRGSGEVGASRYNSFNSTTYEWDESTIMKNQKVNSYTIFVAETISI